VKIQTPATSARSALSFEYVGDSLINHTNLVWYREKEQKKEGKIKPQVTTEKD